MADKHTTKPPVWYWFISGVALLWNSMGVYAYIAQVTLSDAAMAAFPVAQQELYSTTPNWAMVAFALGVFGGVLGSIALLMRRVWAKQLFIVSMVGVVGVTVYQFFLSNTFEVMGDGAKIMPVMIVIGAILLLWFAFVATKKSWIN
ncbi:MAG: hypothetical protein L3J04_10525 [Robiginitomaculum sp.]|nr:hypothetical protein [Robiginitomaculum sp.]